MFRRTTTARLVLSRHRHPPHPRVSCLNTNNYSSSSQPPRDSPGTIAVTFGALIAGACGFYSISQSGASHSVPSLVEPADEGHIPVRSPVKVYSLKAADAKIRQQATSFTFDGHNGHGRIDVVRVASNNPVEDEWAVAVGKGVGGNKTLYAGVYDGHAGWATSAVLRQALIPYVSHAVSRIAASTSPELIDSAIKSAFSNLDARIMNEAKYAAQGAAAAEPGSAAVLAAIAPAVSGSCALLSMYEPASSMLRTAVTGDSRAVLGSWSDEAGGYSAVALSKDQTGFNQDEVRRLDKAHPGEIGDMIDPKTGRLLGIAITRGFGDHRWKLSKDAVTSLQGNFYGFAGRPGYKSPPYMTAEPEVTTRKVATKDFVILASDGLWDVISNDDAVECVSRWLAAKKAGKPETVIDAKTALTVGEDGWPSYKATPEFFAIEDLDNAAVCLVKNALGGNRRTLFCGSMTAYSPVSRYIRDDVTVQVVFFQDPYGSTTK
ncbi:uncharacterized protein G6M90_00g067930 [Metarhizium brunneum]|uniref:PPM-type phosphatase domain-containing protein n=1 Tax=Metarhizium brunneum TaxID=500148 RepID=A0A7D5YUN7_9HYPO